MNKFRLYSSITILFLLSGCSSERVYENIYEGLKTRERLVNPKAPQEQHPQSDDVSYKEYNKKIEDTKF